MFKSTTCSAIFVVVFLEVSLVFFDTSVGILKEKIAGIRVKVVMHSGISESYLILNHNQKQAILYSWNDFAIGTADFENHFESFFYH